MPMEATVSTAPPRHLPRFPADREEGFPALVDKKTWFLNGELLHRGSVNAGSQPVTLFQHLPSRQVNRRQEYDRQPCDKTDGLSGYGKRRLRQRAG